MIRYALLTGVVLAVVVYAWRDWYKSLLVAILFMAVYGRPDVPGSMLGIQGLNPFNLMMLSITAAWAVNRRREKLRWDMPPLLNALLVAYLVIVVVAFGRMMADRENLADFTTDDLVSNFLINTIKWVIPSVLLFDGCRSRKRFAMGLYATLGIYLLLALQCARLVSPSVDAAELERKSREVLENRTGYHRVDLSTMLAGASWAVLASRPLVARGELRVALLGASALVLYGQLLTAGRAGYVAWVGVGLVLSIIKWRRHLLLVPLVGAVVVLALPAVTERMLDGFNVEQGMPGADNVDESRVTAGRSLIWPHVIGEIQKRPWIGHGRQAMRRSGLARFAWEELRDHFGHPHNAYLEVLLDSGILGFVPIMLVYALVVFRAFTLFRDNRSPVFVAAGGVALSLVLAQLAGSIGSQTFYPREGTVGMWCAIMLMLRVSVERSKALARLRRMRKASAQGNAPAQDAPPLAARSIQPQPQDTASRPRTRRGRPLLSPARGLLDQRLWVRT